MKFYKRWPRWLKWGLLFIISYFVLSVILYFGAELLNHFTISDPNDWSGFVYLLPVFIINLPGVFVLTALNGGNVIQATSAIVCLSSVFYFFLGVIVSWFNKIASDKN